MNLCALKLRACDSFILSGWIVRYFQKSRTLSWCFCSFSASISAYFWISSFAFMYFFLTLSIILSWMPIIYFWSYFECIWFEISCFFSLSSWFNLFIYWASAINFCLNKCFSNCRKLVWTIWIQILLLLARINKILFDCSFLVFVNSLLAFMRSSSFGSLTKLGLCFNLGSLNEH